jgi:hypothetical protein
MVIVNGITAYERWENFRKGRTTDGPWVEMEYLVAWTTADNFCDSVLGGLTKSGGPNGNVHYTYRQACPTNPVLYAISAGYIGAGEAGAGSGGRPTFTDAIVTVRYEVPNWTELPQQDPGGQQSFYNDAEPGTPILYADCEIDMAGQTITVPTGTLVFASDSMPVAGVTRGVWDGISTWRITRHKFPYLPYATVMNMANHVNGSTFLGQSRGCVRFANARTKQVKTSDGTRTQNWEMIFEVKPRDWNKFLRPDGFTWDFVHSSQSSLITPYTYDTLSTLLQ